MYTYWIYIKPSVITMNIIISQCCSIMNGQISSCCGCTTVIVSWCWLFRNGWCRFLWIPHGSCYAVILVELEWLVLLHLCDVSPLLECLPLEWDYHTYVLSPDLHYHTTTSPVTVASTTVIWLKAVARNAELEWLLVLPFTGSFSNSFTCSKTFSSSCLLFDAFFVQDTFA